MPAQLTYLKIHEFRHVRPGSVIEFKPGFNVIVGQSGIGKTTLLNLISAISRHDFHEFVEEGISIEYQLRDGDLILDYVFENRVADNSSRSKPDLDIGRPVPATEGSERFNELFTTEPRSTGLGFVRTGETIVGCGLSPDVLSPEQVVDFTSVDNIVLPKSVEPLAQFLELSQYSDARLILTKTHSTSNSIDFGRPFARFRTASGDEIPHDQLSFGEKRLLVFLLELYAHPSTVIVDELASGMHHTWIERCVELLEDFGTQAFLTSQNPVLLDCLPLDRASYALTHTLVVCGLADGEMSWRNLTPHESEDFFRTLDVGIQHISAIMRTKGFW